MVRWDKVIETIKAVSSEVTAMSQRGWRLGRLLDQRRKKYWRIRRPDKLAQAKRDLEAAEIKYQRWSERNSEMLARLDGVMHDLHTEVFRGTRGQA